MTGSLNVARVIEKVKREKSCSIKKMLRDTKRRLPVLP